jgi:hypothetical protein
MTEEEAKLRGLMQLDAKVDRARNQIAEKTDPLSEKGQRNAARAAAKKAAKEAKVEPSDPPTEEPQQ